MKKFFARRFSTIDYAPVGTHEGSAKKASGRSRLVSRTIVFIAVALLMTNFFSLYRDNDQEKWLKEKQRHPDMNQYPASNQTLAQNINTKVKAGFISLVRNSELVQMKSSMRLLESRFNRKFNYPWIFLNDDPFTEKFKSEMRQMTNAEVHFGQVEEKDWTYPAWIDIKKASKERHSARYRYGHLESYRHMCRFQSGLFYQHPLTLGLDYYWRVEPGVEFWCDINYDPFLFMKMNQKVYGFTMAVEETQSTVRSLYHSTKDFIKKHPDYLQQDAALHFITDKYNTSDFMNSDWNLCHFWSNFEIVDLQFYRSKMYTDYFDHLDKAGGFYYERWGDAPIHSLAASLFLNKSQLHFFDDIGYKHENWGHCPYDPLVHTSGKCQCNRNKVSRHQFV